VPTDKRHDRKRPADYVSGPGKPQSGDRVLRVSIDAGVLALFIVDNVGHTYLNRGQLRALRDWANHALEYMAQGDDA